MQEEPRYYQVNIIESTSPTRALVENSESTKGNNHSSSSYSAGTEIGADEPKIGDLIKDCQIKLQTMRSMKDLVA